MKRIAYILSVCFVLYSCSEEYGINKNPINEFSRQDIYNLIEVDEIQFPLDSVTLNIFTASQYIPSLQIYSFLIQGNTIVLFDYHTKELISKIFLETNYPTSYHFLNMDSLFVWNYAKDEISLVNSKGENIYTRKVNHSIEHYPSPATRISPMVYDNGKLTIIGNIAGEYDNEDDNNRKVLMQISLETGKPNYAVPYPKIYEHNWTGGLFRWVYADYNNLTKQYIFSFPADHFIYTYDIESDKVGLKYGGSARIDGVNYVKAPKSKYIDPDSRTKHFAESNSYSRIIHDPYQNVYYRFAEQGISYEGVPGWEKPISIIIMDEKFNIVGETYIGPLKSTYRYTAFVNEQGLHIPKNVKDEDILCFSIYKLVQK